VWLKQCSLCVEFVVDRRLSSSLCVDRQSQWTNTGISEPFSACLRPIDYGIFLECTWNKVKGARARALCRLWVKIISRCKYILQFYDNKHSAKILTFVHKSIQFPDSTLVSYACIDASIYSPIPWNTKIMSQIILQINTTDRQSNVSCTSEISRGRYRSIYGSE